MKEWTCYLAGQMTGISYEESNVWRETAKDWLESRECDYNVHACNPNEYYNFKSQSYVSNKEIIRFDLNKVRNSDLILVNLNGFSLGTAMELQHAFDHKIPILGYKDDSEELHPWLEFVCDRVFNSLTGALEYIKNYYLD
jgi:nucleoside 2-deoxyribosyltransferase